MLHRYHSLTERTEAIQAGSEFAYQQTLDKLNNEYGKVAMAPVAGFEPLAPEFDYDAELGSFAMNLAAGIGSGYLAGKSMMPGGGSAPPPGGVSAASTATTKFTNPASYLKAPTPSSMTGGASFDFFDKFPSGNNFLMDQRVTPLSTFS